jgi:hypothetical protein
MSDSEPIVGKWQLIDADGVVLMEATERCNREGINMLLDVNFSSLADVPMWFWPPNPPPSEAP